MRFSIFLLIFALTCSFSNAGEYRISFDPESFKNQWKSKGLGKKSKYTPINIENEWVLKAESHSGATGVGRELPNDLLDKYPWINFSWKIEKDLINVDPRIKDQHDFSARLLIIDAKRITGSRIVSISHSNSIKDEDLPFTQISPWTRSSRDHVISNKTNGGEWISFKLDAKALMKKLHNFKSFKGKFVLAVFVDGNNSKQHVISYFKDIYFSSE